MARVLKVSKSGYYAWRCRPPSRRERRNAQLLGEIRECFAASRETYGSLRITADLHDRGRRCGHNRVARLMRLNGLRAKRKRFRRSADYFEACYAQVGNKLRVHGEATKPDEVWVSDLTYIKARDGWLFLAAIMDLYSRRIIGWSMSPKRDQHNTLCALRQAVLQRCPAGTLFHTDQGAEFASRTFARALQEHGLVPSMSRRGNCYDNAHMESFFHTLKTELIYVRPQMTRSELRSAIFEYVEGWYNRRRKHSGLGYKSPVDFENQSVTLDHVST